MLVYIILLYITRFSYEYKNKNIISLSEITLTIKGSGNQQIIYNSFSYTPNVLYINDEVQIYVGKIVNNLSKEINIIKVKWNEPLQTCNSMFKGLSNITYIDLSNFNTSQLTNIDNMFYDCTSLTSINFQKFDTSRLLIMEYVFYNCYSLKSLDLSSFDTSKVTDFHWMFYNCSSLVTLDLSNFDTSSCICTFHMFNNCTKLISLNLNSFDTSKVTYIYNMFIGCKSLISLNLNHFSVSSLVKYEDIFTNINPNITFCIESNNVISSQITSNFKKNCSDICFKNPKLIIEKKKCIEKCVNDLEYKYEFNNICYSSCPNGTYSSSVNDYLCVESCNYYNYTNNKCIDSIPEGYYLKDIILKTIGKCDNKCKNCSLESILNNNLCISCNTKHYYYPKYQDNNNHYPFIECYDYKPEGYFLDNIENIYKPCYNTCKSCDKSGDQNSNNCKECISNYIFMQDFVNDSNCYMECPYYYYFDSLNVHHCTETLECPATYKLISEKNKCIEDCNKDEIFRYEYKKKCYEGCPLKTKNISYICQDLNCTQFYNLEQNDCINEIEDGYFLNDTEQKTIDKCHEDCRTCDKKATENNTNCKSCFPETYLLYGNCISICENGFFLDEKDNSVEICKCQNVKCKYCSEIALSLDLCDNCNKDYYPILNDSSNIGTYINCYNLPDGYYLDENDYYYKKCYYSCKKCNEFGDRIRHNCQECINNYIFLEEFPNSHNCYQNCPFYYYFDNENNYFCTDNLECPKDYNKLILEKKKCIDSCDKDGFYNYEFRKQCFNECPPNTNISLNKDYYCEVICPKEYPLEMVETQECVKNCSIIDRKSGLCIINYKDEDEDEKEAANKIQQNIQNDMTNGNFNTSSIANGTDFTFNEGKTSFTVSTTQNQKMNEKTNETTIDLGECEEKLKIHYNIPKDDILFIYLIKVVEDGIIAPKVEYEVYYPFNGDKLELLNLNVCENSRADISVYAPIDGSDIDKHNSSSGFYNDVCYTYTSNKGTDLSLKDRKKEFVDNNYTLCEENCDLTGYDEETHKALCSCQIKVKLPLISEIYIDKNKLYDSFSNIKTLANLKLMKCYKVLFTKEGILYNIGCYIMIPIIILHFITIVVFYIKDNKDILNIINDLIYIKKNWKFLHKNNKIKKQKNKKKRLSNKKNNKQISQNETNVENKKEMLGTKKDEKPVNQTKIDVNNEQIEKPKRDIGEKGKVNLQDLRNNSDSKKDIDLSVKIEEPIFLKYIMKKGLSKKFNIEIEKNNKNENNNSPPIKIEKKGRKKKSYSINLVKTNGNISNSSENNLGKNRINILKNENFLIIGKDNGKGQKLKVNLSLIKYNEYEMNTLSYLEAIKFDKRTYIQFYFSLLKIKHLILFSFFPSNDYNSRIIKIYLFFFSFTIYFTINALFFNENIMHKIYEDGGSFNFIYQIPQILYSSLISSILHSILRTLSLSERNILEIKREKVLENIDKKANTIIKYLSYKFIIFFVTSFIFLIFFWYYVACFCSIYKNTQIFLLKDSLISFALSLLYPIGIYLIPGIFRISSLRAVKGDREFMYKFSKIMQLI